MKRGVDSDEIVAKLWFRLASDFRRSLGDQYCRRQGNALAMGIKQFRAEKFPSRMSVSPFVFKRDYQLETLFKRYRFKDDVYTDQELSNMAIDSFMATQRRLDSGISGGLLVHKVLQRARKIAKKILGDYSLEEHQGLCRFGRRACVGTPYSKSYLDEKVAKPLTGSLGHIRWFKDYLKGDELLAQAIRDASGKKRPQYKMCDTLAVTHVPKSFKALRSICPDTLLGSFYTAGLGRLIQKRLKGSGLNIKSLQQRHGRLAMKSSVSRENVTADLSAASDSLTSQLLMKVLPLPWYRACMFGRIPKVEIGDQIVRMNTVLTMGLGHTFPLQTLVFYSLVESIRQLVGVRGTVSVYGDDLIYPRSIHKVVSVIFPKINLILNGDKTYAKDFFRESCGSDYYRGCNVRPYSPEGATSLLSGLELEQFLYKLYNGLLKRWNPIEIPSALEFLRSMLVLYCDRVLNVPPHMSEESGIHVESWENGYFYEPLEPCYPYHSMWVKYLRSENGRRKPISQTIYYWEKLRQGSGGEDDDRYAVEVDEPVLIWTKIRCKPWTPRPGAQPISFKFVACTVEKRESQVRQSRIATTQFGQLLHETINARPSRFVGIHEVQPFKNGINLLRRSWRGRRLS